MISHRYRCIYVKVPKCASTTVLHWFLQHGRAERSMRPWWYGGLESDRFEAVAHAMNLYPDYYTFSFVRNPYRRFLSLWQSTFLNKDPRFPELRDGLAGCPTMREFAELCGEVLEDFGPLWGADARAFFRENSDRKYGPGRTRLRQLGWVIDHARPQTAFLPDCNPEHLFGLARTNGNPLSFVGRVENMESDFDRVRHVLGLPRFALEHRNVSAAASGCDRPWTSHYDKATRRLVEEIYAADLAFTGCGFDNGCSAVPVAALARPGVEPPDTPHLRIWLARVFRRLWALEIRLEEHIRASATLRRMLRPLKRLRGLPT